MGTPNRHARVTSTIRAKVAHAWAARTATELAALTLEWTTFARAMAKLLRTGRDAR